MPSRRNLPLPTTEMAGVSARPAAGRSSVRAQGQRAAVRRPAQLGPARVDQLATRAVCEAAGVTARTHHHHFGDEDGLVRRGEPAPRVAAASTLLCDALRGAILPGLSVVTLLAGVADRGGAQNVARDTARATPSDTAPDASVPTTPTVPVPAAARRRAADVAATGGLILLGAAGAQTLHTPSAWPRTFGGFGRRVADQTGFYVVQTGAQRALAAGLGWHADETPCRRRGVLPLAACAVARTFTAVDRHGVRRAPVPFLASVGMATAASVLWRPERRVPAEARAFVATRLGVVFAGYAAERLLVEWRRNHGRRP